MEDTEKDPSLAQTEQTTQATAPQPDDPIPAQYKGLPSEVVEELWQNPVHIDAEKNTTETDRRTKTIEAIRTQEDTREQQKEQSIGEQYQKLSDTQKAEFATAQQDATVIVLEHLKGVQNIGDKLTVEEQHVIQKIAITWKEAQLKNPEQALTIQLSKPLDQRIYNNMINRLSFDVLAAKGNIQDQKEANTIRTTIDIPQQPVTAEGLLLPKQEVVQQQGVSTQEQKTQSESKETRGENDNALELLKNLYEKAAKKSRKPEIYKQIFDDLQKENNKSAIAERLVNALNLDKRTASYPLNPNYKEAWELANGDNSLPHKEENNWIYRGTMKGKEGKTVTRGSLNVEVNADTIRALDDLIKQGVMEANYKFGEPDTQADASERHDAITIYFLSQPSQEALQKLSEIAGKHFRGNELIGKKISEGFYMSEVGSVSDKHVSEFLGNLQTADPELGKALRTYLTSRNRTNGQERIAMSEAQFYSVKDALNAYGYDTKYDQQAGISIEKLNS